MRQWLGQILHILCMEMGGGPCVARALTIVDTIMRNARRTCEKTYLLHIERVCVFGAKLGQLERCQGARCFVWCRGQVCPLLHLFDIVNVFIFSMDSWLKFTWLWFLLSVGCWSGVAWFRTVRRWHVLAQSHRNQLLLPFSADVPPCSIHSTVSLWSVSLQCFFIFMSYF